VPSQANYTVMMKNIKLSPHFLLRQHGTGQSAKVTMAELFFDLVFVFAITQLSHMLLADLTQRGMLQTGLLLLAVWSLWNYSTWATNMLDPEQTLVKLLIFTLMFLGLVVSVAIPSAFGKSNAGAWIFATGYLLVHLFRTSFVIYAARHEPLNRRQNFHRNLFWIFISAAPWLLGAAAQPDDRIYWWAAAIGIEFFSPWLMYWTPGLGASKTTDWVIDGEHMAERCPLFVIIALGESLLITGATFAARPFRAIEAIGAASAFLSTVAMWWIYFHAGSEHAAEHIKKSTDPGKVAFVMYSYIHIAIVAGIIVAAVGNEIVIIHPDHADTAAIATIIGGAALFLMGCLLFKWVSYDRKTPPLSHTVGLIALGLLSAAALANWLTTIQISIATATILLIAAMWETLALSRLGNSEKKPTSDAIKNL
jgi:low temperature requirement protein LtrA